MFLTNKTRCFHCVSGLFWLYLANLVLVKTQPLRSGLLVRLLDNIGRFCATDALKCVWDELPRTCVVRLVMRFAVRLVEAGTQAGLHSFL